MSEGLDAHTRSQAEAFAFEGRLPTPQEMQGMSNATAFATGRDTDSAATRSRLQRQSSGPSIDAAERRRLGREYLAKRNQELLDLKNKRTSVLGEQAVNTAEEERAIAAESNDSAVQTLENAIASGSFDELINEDGTLKLKQDESSQRSPTPHFASAPQVSTSPALNAFQSGSSFANPFGDEFAMSEHFETDGIRTPRPPVPPKISLDADMPGSFPPDPPVSEIANQSASRSQQGPDDASYDLQLARALSISLAESEEQARSTLRRRQTEDEDIARAIEDSLNEAKRRSISVSSSRGPLVDFSSDAPQPQALNTPQMTTNPWQARPEDEDLYSLTPMPTGSRDSHDYRIIHDLPIQHANQSPASGTETFSPEGQSLTESSQYGSFNYSPSQSILPIRAGRSAEPLAHSTATLSPDLAPRDVISTGFQSDSEPEDFASLPRSSAQSVASYVEVEDVDIDSMSDDDDGIQTPSSWSEVGSDVDDSERSESEAGDVVRI